MLNLKQGNLDQLGIIITGLIIVIFQVHSSIHTRKDLLQNHQYFLKVLLWKVLLGIFHLTGNGDQSFRNLKGLTSLKNLQNQDNPNKLLKPNGLRKKMLLGDIPKCIWLICA